VVDGSGAGPNLRTAGQQAARNIRAAANNDRLFGSLKDPKLNAAQRAGPSTSYRSRWASMAPVRRLLRPQAIGHGLLPAGSSTHPGAPFPFPFYVLSGSFYHLSHPLAGSRCGPGRPRSVRRGVVLGEHECGGGGAGADAGAVEDVFHVFAHGRDGDEQPPGDLGVAEALVGESEHLPFPRGELGDVTSASLGLDVDLPQMWPEQFDHKPVAFGEAQLGAPPERNLAIMPGQGRE
jgi:hypothetical protein